MNIISNYHWHNFLYGYELPETIRADFDYIDVDEFDSHGFIKYKGIYYDAGEFMRCDDSPDNEISTWHGYHADSYFSGVLIRCSDDGDQYQIATYIS